MAVSKLNVIGENPISLPKKGLIMKTALQKSLFFLIFFISPFFLVAQNTYVVKRVNGEAIYEIYQLNLTPEPTLTFQFQFNPNTTDCNDIAISPSGKFYGVGYGGIYEISQTNGGVTFLQEIPLTGINTTLVCSNEDILYVLNSAGYLYQYDIENGLLEEIAQLEGGSPGDITFYKGNLVFPSSVDGNIKAYNLANQSLVTIHCMAHPLNNSGQGYFGFSNNEETCESLSFIGATTANELYEIDIANNTISHIELTNPFLELKTLFLGTASTTEHFSSNCSHQFSNIDCAPKDTSSFFVLGKTTTENIFHIYSLNPDQTLTFKYEFYSEFGCSDIAYVPTGIIYGIGTDDPATLFKINPISGKVQELVKYPAGKTIESIVSDYYTSIYSIDQEGRLHIYDIYCNSLNTFFSPFGHAPATDLAFQNKNIIFQSKVDGNIKAINVDVGSFANILCLNPPYNDTANGGFIGLGNDFTNCELNKLTAFNHENTMYEINFDSEMVFQLPLNLTGLAEDATIQGTAYNNLCSQAESEVLPNIICETAVVDLVENIQLTLFPNPVKDVLQIRTDIEINQISVYDVKGRLCKDISDLSDKVNLEWLSSGVYLLEIHTELGRVVKKVVKE